MTHTRATPNATDTPERGRFRDRELVVLRYLQHNTAGPVSLSGLFEWIKKTYGSDVLYDHSFRDWSVTVSRKLALSGRAVVKDVVSKTYKLDRQALLIARTTSEGHEQLVADGAYREFVRSQRANSLKRAVADPSGVVRDCSCSAGPGLAHDAGAKQEPIVDEDPKIDRRDENGEKKSSELALEDSMSESSEGGGDVAEAVHGNVRVDPVASNGKRIRGVPTERPPRYEKRARPELPVRHPWENDTAFCFRMLSYLETVRVISEEQNKKCRRVLIDDLSKGLAASLLQYSLDGNEKAVREFVDYVVPRPPSLLQHVAGAVRGELARMTLRTVTTVAVKAIGYGLAVVGTATVLRVKNLM